MYCGVSTTLCYIVLQNITVYSTMDYGVLRSTTMQYGVLLCTIPNTIFVYYGALQCTTLYYGVPRADFFARKKRKKKNVLKTY